MFNRNYERNKAYFKTDKGRDSWNRASKKAYRKYPEKMKARAKLRYAVKMGKILKPLVCEMPMCKESKVQAHHHKGYNLKNALDVMWLCQQHHWLEHHEPVVRFIGTRIKCEACPNTLIPFRRTQRFCSKVCSLKTWYEKKWREQSLI